MSLPKVSLEYERVFETLPDVLIQHPAKACAYLIPATELIKFKARSNDFVQLGSDTVTFSISGEELLDEVPPFNQDASNEPNVLIRYLKDRTAYFLSFSQLEQYRVSQPETPFGDHYISFIMPGGMELVQEIPFLKRGLLQSNTG